MKNISTRAGKTVAAGALAARLGLKVVELEPRHIARALATVAEVRTIDQEVQQKTHHQKFSGAYGTRRKKQ